MSKKDKNDQNINNIPKYLWGNYFKKPIKWLAHLINDYGNTKLSIYPTGTAFVYAISDERKRHPELTYQQAAEKVQKLYNQIRKNIGLPTETTPSLSAAGLAVTGGSFSPWFTIPDIVFDVAASIDEPSTSNNLHTIADFPETVAKFTPSKIDDYVAKGVLTLGNIDDAVSTSGRNMFSIFDKKTGKINNTIDKTSVRESTNIRYRKNGGQIRKMQTAAGGPIELYDTLWVDNWKNRLTSPTVVAKQLTKLTSKIPIKYLGGNKDNVRKEFWKQEPVFQHAVDSIANQYGISPESLKYRLDKEGFTDRLIQRRNATIKIGALRFEPRGYELLNNPNYGLAGTQIGLDDAKTYIDSGKVKLINENWDEQGPFKNEKGRMTYPVNPVTLNDGMGIVAAHLKYFRDEALLDFPNGSEYDLDRYANAYYNRGAYGGKKWVLTGAKGYNYKKQGGILEFLKNGGQVRKMQTAAGGGLVYDDGKNIGRTNYNNWSKLSFVDKMKRRFNIAKHLFNESSSPIINSVGAIFGEYDPENPDLNTGEAPSPGWGKQGVTGLHKMMFKLPEAKLTLLAPLAGRSRAASTLKMEDIVKAQLHRDEVYKRWASLYKLLYDPTPTTFRTKPARVKRLETDISKSNGRTLAEGKGNAGGSYSSKSHTIRVTSSNKTSAKNLEDIAFHEGIHSYGLGESPSYVWKSKYLNFPEGTNPYFLDPKEIATHGIQQGQNLGIKVGQTYPGREAMIKMIENRPEGLGFGGVPMILYNNAKTNSDYRRLWSLLNGTFKQGGKINMIEFLKNGSGIHIKEKNKGKFTSYCGGKVTDKCILKGKNSSNPAIRKRAIFAANARKWKHEKGGIIKAEDGILTSLLGLLPGVGTYLDYKEFEKNPNWKTGLSLGISALGDATMLTGAGAIIKGISATNKARKILGTASKASNVARLLVWNQASKLKRESDAVNSLTLMGAPTNKIIERLTSKNLAKQSYEKALKNDEHALKFYQAAGNNPALNFNSSQFAPLIYTNPSFHATSQTIKHKSGGKAFVKGVNVLDSNPNIYRKKRKFQEGGKNNGAPSTKFLSKQWFNNAGNNIGNFLNSDTGKGLLNIGSLIFNGIKTGADVADFSNSFDLATDSTIKAMDSKMKADSYKQGLLKAKEYILLKLLENPDTHFGEVDLMNLANNFSNEFYDSQAIEDYKTQRANEKLLSMQAILDSAGSSGIFSLLLKGLGIISEGSKKSSNNISSNLNLLNYSTIGKSTNPYMYTGLGANTSTFFTK